MRSDSRLVVREAEAAQMLGVSTAALKRWRREGRGPAFVKIERCVAYRFADLEEFLESNTVQSWHSQTATPNRGN